MLNRHKIDRIDGERKIKLGGQRLSGRKLTRRETKTTGGNRSMPGEKDSIKKKQSKEKLKKTAGNIKNVKEMPERYCKDSCND